MNIRSAVLERLNAELSCSNKQQAVRRSRASNLRFCSVESKIFKSKNYVEQEC
jgi:hypothetical protein